MKTNFPFVAATLALGLAACATTGADGPQPVRTTSNPVTGAATTASAGAKAVGAYGSLGTSDDVRGLSSGSGTSVLNGRANMAGTDSGTSADSSSSATPPPHP